VTTPAAGWYPDPAGSGDARWWDGATWTQHVQPVGAPAGPTWGAQPGQVQQWGAQPQQWAPGGGYGAALPQQAPATGLRRNRHSLTVAGFVLVYLLLAVYAHLIVLGLLPAVFAARAIREKEPLAIPAAMVAGAVLLFALYEFVAR
jgi:hypothetical protein